MAHKEQREFCQGIKERFPDHFDNTRVVDFGSLDINGSNKQLFPRCNYMGVDIGMGNNVDMVCHTKDFPIKGPWDVVISTEMLEHDKEWKESLQKMVSLVRKGGLLIITCATYGRAEHGTQRSLTPWASPFTTEEWGEEYYKNLTEKDFREAFNPEELFKEFGFEVNNTSKDLYFWGIKK